MSVTSQLSLVGQRVSRFQKERLLQVRQLIKPCISTGDDRGGQDGSRLECREPTSAHCHTENAGSVLPDLKSQKWTFYVKSPHFQMLAEKY